MGEFTRNTALAVGLSIVQISPPVEIGQRIEFSYRNNSTAGQVISVFLSNTQQAVAGSGITLAAGQSVTQSKDQGYTPWQGNVTAIADAAAGSLGIYERVVQ